MDGIVLREYMLVTMLIQVIVAKLLYQFIFLYLLYMKKDINPEIKINDIKRFIVNSFASVQYENISVVLSNEEILFNSTNI